ncbi:hypothetical protein CP556_12725 [Natrinema sp. CBA1119]|nr:hypothetical protein CP556_12725 [Natrinema sp. CBA1119]
MSAVVLSVVGYVTFPLGDVWRWISLLPTRGDIGVFAVITIVIGLIGFGITTASSIRLSEFAIGGVLAYVFGMVVLSFVIPEMLMAYFVYGFVLVCALLGSVIATVIGNWSTSP